MGHIKPLLIMGMVLGMLAAVQALSSNPGQLKGAQDTTPENSMSLASSAKHGLNRRAQHRKSKQDYAKSPSQNSYKAPSQQQSDNKPHEHDSYGEQHHDSHNSYSHDLTPPASYPPQEQYQHNSYGPYPDHESYGTSYDDPYWGPRYQAKAELIACVRRAVDLFDREEVSTWQGAGEALAQCLKEFFDGCHDVPGLDIDLTSSLPFALFINALDTYATDPGSMEAAAAVFSFYLNGGRRDSGVNYLGDDSCPAKLTALLQSGAYYSRNTFVMNSLADMVVHMLDETHSSSSALASCKADFPAVLLALSSTYCISPTGELYNPFEPANPIECAYNRDLLYENSAGAKLGAAIISGLLLSRRPQLSNLGFQLAWNMNLLALSGTFTSNFADCPREIQEFLDGFPDYSGPLGVMEARGIDTPSAASKQVLCASIAAMNGGPVFRADNGTGNGENVLWQGTANVYNALFKSVQAIQADTVWGATTFDPSSEYYRGSRPRPSITQLEIAGLCAATKAVYSIDADGPMSDRLNITVVVPAPVRFGERSRPCYTSDQFVPAGPPGVPPARPFEGLKTGHTLNLETSKSPAARVCGWDLSPLCIPPP